MASVQSSRGKKYESSVPFGEEPTLHVESEGERLIHDLCLKQLDTNLTLEKQLSQVKEFERGSGYVPLSAHNPGSSTLRELQDKVSKEENLEKLQVLGLTVKEANAVLNGDDLTFPDSKIETSLKRARAEEIKRVIENSKNDFVERNLEKDCISRHEKELALAVKPDSTETKLLQFALSCQNHKNVIDKDVRPLEHPINRLHELEEKLFGEHNPIKLANMVKRKRRQHLEACLPPQGPQNVQKLENEPGKKSLWDQDIIVPAKKIKKSTPEHSYTCKKQTYYTIKDGKIIEIGDDKNVTNSKINDTNEDVIDTVKGQPFVSLVSENINSDNNISELKKLTEDEIKTLPRFQNYCKGVPSKVLYLKNLSNSIKEDDLVQLFRQFECPEKSRLIYRLMTGKMRGQGFITFPDEETSKKALDTINGTVLKGKPIIIQFGKS